MRWFLSLLFASLLILVGCGEEPPEDRAVEQAPGEAPADAQPEAAMEPADDAAAGEITAGTLAAHVRTLASDEFLGREPAGPGEEKTIAYIAEQFERAGLEPGNRGSWFQEVPLVGITLEPGASLEIEGLDEPLVLEHGKDTVVWTRRIIEEIGLDDSELVFVGYGIVAPEHDWNDYEGLDADGKTVVMLVNDPGYASQDPELFDGNAMTYYGRWTYKYEEAARQGAAGAIVIHEAGPAGYPWDVVTGGWTGTQFSLDEEGELEPIKVESWITHETADRLFRHVGSSYEDAKRRALDRDATPLPLELTASTTLRNSIETTTSRNVIGVVEGSERPDETVLYMGHWDHMGHNPELEDNQIYNGAVDNATGIAGLIEIGRQFAARAEPPERTVVFLAVTAEEQGLLGSKYYSENPVYPLEKTAGTINMDSMKPFGRTRNVVVVGHGSSEMEEYLKKFAGEQGRGVEPEPTPEKGFYFRSDHFNFAKKGVPSLYAEAGTDLVEGGRERGDALHAEYIAERYHKPADEFHPDWDFGGMIQDFHLYYRIGADIADSEAWPEWYPGNAFRAIRQESAQVREDGDQ